MILAEPLHEPKVRQGITTEVIGVDGNSYAPFATQEDLDAFVHLNAGLDGDPRRTHKTKIDWSTVASYLARFDGTVSLNIAYLIGNSPLRIAGRRLGGRARRRRASAASDASLLREGMEDGAFGLSSGLDYPPGELRDDRGAGGARTRKPAGTAASTTPTSATRSATASSTRSARRSRSAGAARRRPTSPTSTTARRSRARPDRMLDLVDAARKEGLDVTFDAYPYEWASTRLLILIPIWVQAGGPIKTKERLADPDVRNRIRRELQERGALFAGAGGLRDVRIGYLHRPELLRVGGPDARRADRPDRTATRSTRSATCCSPRTSAPTRSRPGRTLDGIRRFLRHPIGMVGTDSTFVGEKPSPRTYGSFPRILGQFVRDEALLSLEEAIRRMTSAPAARLGLTDRGTLQGRRGRGRRRLRSGDRPQQRDLRRAAPVPRRHRARDRQRRAGRRRTASTPARRRAARSGTAGIDAAGLTRN